MTNVAGVILAGGKSSRMGEDKSKLRHHGVTMQGHMVTLLKQAEVPDIYVSSKSAITDEIKEKGPLSGIHATLKALQGEYNYLLYMPVDMPALKPSLLQQLIHAPPQYDVVRFGSYMLPFRLKVDASLISFIEEALLDDGNHSLKQFQHHLNPHILPINITNMAYFSNVNTPEEWTDYTLTPAHDLE